MEKILGRKLEYNEIVHHKDENGKNNDPDNLEIKSRSKHSKEHMLGNIPKEETRNKLRIANSGSKSKNSKLTEEQVLQIREKYKNGVKPKDLAKEYFMGYRQIYSILNNEYWKHI